MGSGPKPVTGYTTTGNVNTDQQFSGPMPWESQPPRPAAPPTGGVMPMPAPTQEMKPTGGVTPMPAPATPPAPQAQPPLTMQGSPMSPGQAAMHFNSDRGWGGFRPMPMMGGFGGFNPYGGFGGGFNRGYGGYGGGGGCGHM